MRARPFRKCRLCLNEALLCDSHLIPKAMYRAYNTKINLRGLYLLSHQMKDYLLCSECEQRFRKLGEDWATANCCRDDGSYRVLGLLEAAPPLPECQSAKIFKGHEVPGLDIDAIIYFGMSVFWRAGVHEWRDRDHVCHIDLGPFEERIRQYLLGAPFPENVQLLARVIASRDVAQTAYPPGSGNASGFHYYRFSAGGFVYIMLVGSRSLKTTFGTQRRQHRKHTSPFIRKPMNSILNRWLI